MDIVERLDGLINAYPLDIFPEPTTEDRAWVEEAKPGFQAQIVASWARHLGRPLAEARAEITALRKRVEELEGETVRRGKTLVRLRDKLINICDGLEDQGDLVALRSTNDADDFREAVRELDSFKWGLILAEDDALARAETAEAALAAMGERETILPTPGEWALVPTMSTPAMDVAGVMNLRENPMDASDTYEAMIAAAPHLPRPEAVEEAVKAERERCAKLLEDRAAELPYPGGIVVGSELRDLAADIRDGD